MQGGSSSHTGKASYLLTTNNELDKRSFQIKDAASGRSIWSSERTLTQDEILEVVTDLSGQSSCTVHQPTRGWYLLIKSSDRAFTAAQPYVNLVPSRTNPSQDFRFTVKAASIQPVQDGGEGKVDGTDNSNLTTSRFLLQPHWHEEGSKRSNRLSLRNITEIFASKKNSFSLFWDNAGQNVEVLHFDDHPKLLHTDTQGTLLLDEPAIARLNIDRTFFVTVAIAYLGFLEDQAAYKAAS